MVIGVAVYTHHGQRLAILFAWCLRESGHRGVHSDGILKLWPVYDRIISGHRMVSGPMATPMTGLFFAVYQITSYYIAYS